MYNIIQTIHKWLLLLQKITDLITQTTQIENLQNKEWNENNCFNVGVFCVSGDSRIVWTFKF